MFIILGTLNYFSESNIVSKFYVGEIFLRETSCSTGDLTLYECQAQHTK